MTGDPLTWQPPGTPEPGENWPSQHPSPLVWATQPLPAHVAISPAPRLTWQVAHGRRISSLSEVKCPSHEIA